MAKHFQFPWPSPIVTPNNCTNPYKVKTSRDAKHSREDTRAPFSSLFEEDSFERRLLTQFISIHVSLL